MRYSKPGTKMTKGHLVVLHARVFQRLAYRDSTVMGPYFLLDSPLKRSSPSATARNKENTGAGFPASCQRRRRMASARPVSLLNSSSSSSACRLTPLMLMYSGSYGVCMYNYVTIQVRNINISACRNCTQQSRIKRKPERLCSERFYGWLVSRIERSAHVFRTPT